MSYKLNVLLFIVLVSLIIPTTAFSLQATQSAPDPISNDIVIEPTTGPNGQYASIDNGHLTLDFDALNDRSVTTADDVFTIGIADNGTYEVWIEDGPDEVTFYADGDRSTPLDASNALELDVGESTSVGVAIDTHEEVSGDTSFTIRAVPQGESEPESGGPWFPPEGVSLTSVDVDPTSVDVGEPTSVRATYRNTADDSRTHTSKLTVDGASVDDQTITLDPGESVTVTFEHSFESAGEYAVGIDDQLGAIVSVGGESPVSLVDVAVEPASLEVGGVAAVTATYENRGEETETITARLTEDGIVVDEQSVTVPAGETRTVTFERTMDAVGSFDLGVDDHPGQTVTVGLPDGPAGNVTVTNASVLDDEIVRGQQAVVEATVENRGNATGTATIEFAVGGIVLQSTAVELDPGESRNLTFAWGLHQPGTYDLAVSGVDAGTITVVEPGEVSVLNRELAAPAAVAIAPPVAGGVLFVVIRRRP